MKNRVTDLFQIQYPIFQAGMIWCSGWKLAAASSNAGCLGIIGAGSMYPEVLEEHISKLQAFTSKPFGVNVPLLYPDIEKLMEIIIRKDVKVVITSAGNPAIWTSKLKEHGITVVHVIANTKFALKAESAGVDAIIAEGFEAGGHNGKEETTTLCLIPEITDKVKIPVIAAGGIASGKSMAAVMALGAEGVQIGSRFAASTESSAHENFKDAIRNAKEGDTKLMLKDVVPVRLLRNKFFGDLEQAYDACKSKEDKLVLLGRARAKKGMFLGDMDEGELEIGQISSMISKPETVQQIVTEIVSDYNTTVLKASKHLL
ncbi:MAG: enoyl-[acyl-carrier protein] reductase II [Bacteroidia bacterium]|jgi:enoyl-[acyl-carrier protein] reductase II